MITIDGLNAIGEVARQKVAREGGSIAAMTRAHTRAMVGALMEHFVTGISTHDWDADDVHSEFMKIIEQNMPKFPGETCKWEPSGFEYFIWKTACQRMLGKEHDALQTGICLCGRAALVPEATP